MRFALLLVTALLVGLAGCGLGDLRTWLQGEPLDGVAELVLTVEPGTNIAIFIDGKPVATASPYHAKNLSAGVHHVQITSPGYHPMQLPITLEDGQRAELPIQLRPIEEDTAYKSPPRRPKPSRPQSDKDPSGSQRLSPSGTLTSVSVRLAIDPPGPVFVDGKAVGQGASVTIGLFNSEGVLTIGAQGWPRSLVFGYQLESSGKLFIVVQGPISQWRRNGAPMQKGRRRFMVGTRPQRYDLRKGGVLQRGVVFKLLCKP